MHATYSTQPILLHSVTLVICAEEYKFWNHIFQLQDAEQHTMFFLFITLHEITPLRKIKHMPEHAEESSVCKLTAHDIFHATEGRPSHLSQQQ
jgi:hypothetical protein